MAQHIEHRSVIPEGSVLAAAETLQRARCPLIYRVHDEPAMEKLQALRELGCDLGQGYYFARPQAPEALDKLLTSARLGELIS